MARIERRLSKPLPGLEAQLRMITTPRIGHRPTTDMERTCARAGVLVLIFHQAGRLYLLLTRRTDTVLHHKGQISFPGGRREPGEDVQQTALRETREELGIAAGGLRVLGLLTPLYIPPSDTCIHPVVAFSEGRPEIRPQPAEVAEVIEVPLENLLDPAAVRCETWTLRGYPVVVPFFPFGDFKIWGATAMVLAEFLEVLRSADAG